MKAVYKMNIDCGRMGNLEGVFVAEKSHIDYIINKKLDIYFGEVLGKHSEISGVIDESEIKMVSDNPEVVKVIEENDLSSGFNPLYQTVLNCEELGLIGHEDEELYNFIDEAVTTGGR